LNTNGLVGSHQVYVNVTRNMIGHALPFDKSRLVIEVFEDIVIDDDVVTLIKALADEGDTIALNDFKLNAGAARRLLLANIVKLDVIALERPTQRQHYLATPVSDRLT
jgi:EAL and modified HD-GYP domain-containing signal transduction protein